MTSRTSVSPQQNTNRSSSSLFDRNASSNNNSSALQTMIRSPSSAQQHHQNQQRSHSSTNAATAAQEQEDDENNLKLRDTITTLHEAAEAFDLVSSRAQRCSLQIATWKSNEQQVRKFLIDRVLPHADEALRDREVSSQKREEDYGTAMLRLKGVQLPEGSPPRSMMTNNTSSSLLSSGSSKRMGSSPASLKASEFDPQLGTALENLKHLTTKYGKRSDGSP